MNYKELLYDKDKVACYYPELAVIFNEYAKIQEEIREKNGEKKERLDNGGLNKAIVLNQLSYWLGINEKAKRNFKDGYFWMYDSYAKWAKRDFPFWSADTVKRAFVALEKDGIVISANYNSFKVDKTKWYRIDYKRLQEVIDTVIEYRKEHFTEEESNLTESKDEVAPMDGAICTDEQGNITQPIPEITTEITSRDYSTENTPKSFSNEKEERKVSYGDKYKSRRERVHQSREYSEADKVAYENELPEKMADVYREFGYENKHLTDNVEFATRYFIETRRKHINTPMLPYTHDAIVNMVMAMDSEQTIESMNGGTMLTTTYQSMICSEIGTDEIESLIDSYFDTKFKGSGGKPCDYSLAHFLSDGVQKFLKAKSGDDIWWYCESEVL